MTAAVGMGWPDAIFLSVFVVCLTVMVVVLAMCDWDDE